jgi:DNA-binding CsgD family transcriptional regulator
MEPLESRGRGARLGDSHERAAALAAPLAARKALWDALVRVDAADSERYDARLSAELWRSLAAGGWLIVDHCERDGRRYFLAKRNAPELAQDRALSKRERQVLAYVELGHSNKLIAYWLGLSPSTISTLVSRARKKAGHDALLPTNPAAIVTAPARAAPLAERSTRPRRRAAG